MPRQASASESPNVELAASPAQDGADEVKIRKEPPPEAASKVQTRRYVILSFWLLALVLGLPTWWKTTTVYRAGLPLQRMSEWASGNVYDRSCYA